MREFNILGLGAGVQSTTLFLLSCRGLLPKYDVCVFADTKWESAETYRHLDRLEAEGAKFGLKIARVSGGNLRDEALAGARGDREAGSRGAWLPMFVTNPPDSAAFKRNRELAEYKNPNWTAEQLDAYASRGIIRRQCTGKYKVDQIERYLRREFLGLAPGARVPADIMIRHHIGISADESGRTKGTNDYWKVRVYPLCLIGEESLKVPWTRDDCKAWLRKYYPDWQVPRSACKGCPFHDDDEWLDMKNNRPDEWADAVQFERDMQAAHNPKAVREGAVYLHDSRVPLDQVELKASRPADYPTLWREECLGMCGV